MSLDDLITLLQNRLSFNAQQRAAAAQRGDIAQVSALDADSATTQSTLDALQAV
jgi:hypothetical protein